MLLQHTIGRVARKMWQHSEVFGDLVAGKVVER